MTKHEELLQEAEDLLEEMDDGWTNLFLLAQADLRSGSYINYVKDPLAWAERVLPEIFEAYSLMQLAYTRLLEIEQEIKDA